MRKKTGVLKDHPRRLTDSQLKGLDSSKLTNKQRRRLAMRHARNHAIQMHSFERKGFTSKVASVRRSKKNWRLFYVTVEVVSKPASPYQKVAAPDRSIHWYEVHKGLGGKVSVGKPA